MSALFSALFGTPMAAAVFPLEVITIGRIRLIAAIPCAFSSAIAYAISQGFGVTAERFRYDTVPAFSFSVVMKSIVVIVLAALLSSLFCKLLHFSEKLLAKLLKNAFLRAFVCGSAVVIISVLSGSTDYNGGGIGVITRIFTEGEFRYEAFALKILLTVLTVAGGYKGGEIVPSLFIGATFGATCSGLIGLDHALRLRLAQLQCSAVLQTVLLLQFLFLLNCSVSAESVIMLLHV